MKKEYLSILNKAESRYVHTKKAMNLLSKRRIKNFDRIVQRVNDEIFSVIDCKLCANCCRKLGPMFNDADIQRAGGITGLSSHDFSEKYLKYDEDGDRVFKSMPCPFSCEDMLCSIYESRPKACREYPHAEEKNMQSHLGRLAQNTLYCPAAYLISEELSRIFM